MSGPVVSDESYDSSQVGQPRPNCELFAGRLHYECRADLQANGILLLQVKDVAANL